MNLSDWFRTVLLLEGPEYVEGFARPPFPSLHTGILTRASLKEFKAHACNGSIDRSIKRKKES